MIERYLNSVLVPREMLRVLIVLCSIFLLIQADSDPSVIIIGAGPAGVAAAAKLLEHGIKDVKVLEAEDRIGGRVNSVRFGEAYVDLGAEFCHGQENNVVYDMVKDFDPKLLDPGPPFVRFHAYNSNGERIDPILFMEITQFLLLDVSDIAKSYGMSVVDDPTVTSLGDYFLNIYNNTILEKYRRDKDKLEVVRNVIPLLEMFLLGLEGAFDWYQPTAEGHYEHCEGDQTMTWRGHGYKIILDVLTKAYPNPDEKLDIDFLLNKEVTQINWSGRKISIECDDRTVYSADHVIFTPSVGVLKSKHTDMFEPKLPKWKQDAITGIGFGGVLKIFLHFQTKWWMDNFAGYVFVWRPEDLKKSGHQFHQGLRKNGVSWVTQIQSLQKSANNSNVLVAWITGHWVPEIEQLSTKTLKDGTFFLIKKFLGNDHNVTEPDKLIHSTWCTNSNFQGTYSYETPESHRKGNWNQKQLMRPLNNTRGTPVVLFAGEATNPIHYATVHGAIETGQREAGRILDLYEKLRKNK